jgi:dCTP diphosphatase
MDLEELVRDLRSFAAERNWGQFHDPKNLSMLLASEAGELLSLFRWVPNSEADAFAVRDTAREQVEHEIADVAIALLMLCDRLGVDLQAAVRRKIEVNGRNYPVEKSRGRPNRPA